LALLALSGLAFAGCNKDATPEPATPEQAPVEAEPTTASAEEPKDEAELSDVNISDKIREACGISDTDAHFEFDSANVRPEDEAMFSNLAQCFIDGPLKGEKILFVGHADARGEAEYNLVLAGRRAENISGALKNAGVAAEQLSATSRGEMDAKGDDESSMAQDRRVDILLASE
jgi:peptidoglycan-associated lipoprotein